MAKLSGLRPNMQEPAFGDRVVIRSWRGRLVMQSWPRKRGRDLHPTVSWWNEWFRQANKLAKYAPALDQYLAIEYTRRSGLYPRDILMSAMRGRLFEELEIDGKRWVSMSVREDVSINLDVIGQTTGSVLFRDAELWNVLPPGSAGQVLSVGANGLPAWSNASSQGVGAGGYAFSKRSVANSWAYPAKGELLSPPFDIQIHTLAAWVNWSSSVVYRFMIIEIDAGLVSDVLYDSGQLNFATGSANRQYHKLVNPVTLTAGKSYGILLTGDDGSGSLALPLYTTTSPTEGHFYTSTSPSWVRVSTPIPNIGNAVETGAGGFAVEYAWSIV